MKLEIELIPKTSFFTNVRSMVSLARWDVLRKACYAQAGYRCEICAGKGPKWPVECHEIWEYDFDNKIQRLVRLIALCPACHEVKHIGLAEMRGRMYHAKGHLMKVNRITPAQADRMIAQAIADWKDKNTISWKVDISALGE